MTHVLGIGHAATHCGESKKPMHSVHFSGSMANSKLLFEMAVFGHSLTHAKQPVQEDSLIMYAIVTSLLGRPLRLPDYEIASSKRYVSWLQRRLPCSALPQIARGYLSNLRQLLCQSAND